MPTKDLEDYRRFTKPAELHKAVNTLRGLVQASTPIWRSALRRSQSWSIGVRFTLNSVTAILSLKFCLW